MSHPRPEYGTRLVWVVHRPTGSSDYGQIEDIAHDEDGSRFLIIRVSEYMKSFLKLSDRYIDMRYAHIEFEIQPMIPMPDFQA